MKSALAKSFYDSAVFIIASPQEAAALLILSKKNKIKKCIVINYLGYSDGDYLRIIKSILLGISIDNLYFIDMYFYLTYASRGCITKTLKSIYKNIKIIKDFDSANFQGNLFNLNYSFVVQKDSPFISLAPYPLSKIYLMEHSPADSRERLKRLKNISNSSPIVIDSKIPIFIKFKIKILSKFLSIVFPFSTRSKNIINGYTWLNYGDNFHYLDYRDVQQKISLKRLPTSKVASKRTLFLMEHPEMFRDVPQVYHQVKESNFVNMYRDMLIKHVDINDVVICKFHPFITQNISNDEMQHYLSALRECFLMAGFKKIIFFQDLFDPGDIRGSWPVEMFIDSLGVSRVLGLYSSTMLIVQNWDGLQIISDCSSLEYFRSARARDHELFSLSFKCFP